MTIIALKPAQRLVDLVGALRGKWHGYAALCRCPAHADRTASLSLRQGRTSILVHCFAGCNPEDVLRELDRIRPGRRFDPPIPARSGSRGNINRLWSEGLPIEGTLGKRYLRGRGLSPEFADLLFHPRCPCGPAPRTRFLPALLVGVRENAKLCAIQRIFLDPATGRYTEKMMIGSPSAGTWRGRPATDTLALAEGFETAAAFMQIHGIPCWSPLGAWRLDRVELPASVRTLIIAEDNDSEGRRAARKAWAAYRPLGLTLRRMPPPAGFADWNKVVEPE